MIEDIKKDASHRMDRAIQVLEAEYAKLRTGRASASLLDHVRVEYYGAELPVSQAANVTVEDARTITITAWASGTVLTLMFLDIFQHVLDIF